MVLNLVLFRKTGLVAVFLLSLLLASAPFIAQAAGGGSYSAAPSKPAGYDAAVKLIKEGQFAKAIPVLHDIEAKARDDADVQNLLGFAYRKTASWTRRALIMNRPCGLIPNIRARWNIRASCFDAKGQSVSRGQL